MDGYAAALEKAIAGLKQKPMTAQNLPKITKGVNQSGMQGKELSFTADFEAKDLKKVLIDQKEIDAKNYVTAGKENTQVTLKAEYTKSCLLYTSVQDLEKTAYDFGNQEIEQEHLLYNLLHQDDSLILKMIEKMEINKEHFLNRVETALNDRVKVSGGQPYIEMCIRDRALPTELTALVLS